MIPSPYSRQSSRTNAGGRSRTGSRTPRQDGSERSVTSPVSRRTKSVTSPRQPLSPKSQVGGGAPSPAAASLNGVDGDKAHRTMASPAARSAATKTDQQENTDFPPRDNEKGLLKSLSSFVDRLRSHDARSAAPVAPSSPTSAANDSPSAAPEQARLGSVGSIGLDEESLRHMSLFIDMLQRSDADLAGELGQIVKALSSEDVADVARSKVKPETRSALEAYIDGLSGKKRSPPLKDQRWLADHTSQVVGSSPRSEMANRLSTGVTETTAGMANTSLPPAIEREGSGIGGLRSKSEDSMERFKASSPRSGVAGLQAPSAHVETIEDFRSTSGDSLDRLNCSPRSVPVEAVNKVLSDDSMARYTNDIQLVSPRHFQALARRDDHRWKPEENTFLVEKHEVALGEPLFGRHESQRGEAASPRLAFRLPGPIIPQEAEARSGEACNDPITPECTEEIHVGTRTMTASWNEPTSGADEVPQSDTFTSNDLDTVALSLLGHYVDEVSSRPNGKNMNSKSRLQADRHGNQLDGNTQARFVERLREEPESGPLVGVDACGSLHSIGDSSSHESMDLSSFAPAVAAAKKAAMEESQMTPRRQKVDPPSVNSNIDQHDPPTLRSPGKIDVDLDLSPSLRNATLFSLEVEVKSPGRDRLAVTPGRTSFSSAYSPRDPEVISDVPRFDSTGELNPRCESTTSRLALSPTYNTTPSATIHNAGNSPTEASLVDRLGAGHRTVSSWNEPSDASSADRGSVKIIFFDKTKGKRKIPKKSSGVDASPPTPEREDEGTQQSPQRTSNPGLAGSTNVDAVLPETPIEPDSLPPSPLRRPESSSVLEPIVEIMESNTAPTLSSSTMADEDKGKSLALSVSALRNEMGSSDGEISLSNEEKNVDLTANESMNCEMLHVVANTNPKMRDMLSHNDADETLRKLWKLIPQPEYKPTKGKGKPEEDKDQQFEKFAALVAMTIPFFEAHFPTPVEKAHLQVQARRKNIPVTVTNFLMDALCSLSERESALGLSSVPKSIQALSKSEHLTIRREALLRRLLRLLEAERRRDVMIYSSAASSEEEAVEIDLAGLFQFAMNDYDSSSEDSVEGPWWESTAKLTKVLERSRDSDDVGFSGSSSQECYDTETDTDNDSHAKKVRKPPSVDDEIRGFWKNRKRRPMYYRLRQRGGLPSVGTASFSATENDGNSTSVSSVSSTRYDPEAEEELWARKRDIAMWPKGPNGGWLSRLTSSNWIRAPGPINAVNATVYFALPAFVRHRHNPGTQQWAQPYAPRIAAHIGYFNVNVKSLYDASSQYGIQHPQDLLPWERREVKQRFLQEQSVSYNRNWFGTTKKVYGNNRLRQPVCRPKSMEMPMKAGEWTEEWYKKPWESLSITQSLSAGDADLQEIAAMRKRYTGTDDAEEVSWEETPECGTIRNVKLKIGERVTRVTPDLTCSLRRSRWRKKFFPKGTFPY